MSLEAETAEVLAEEKNAPGFTFTRAGDAHPHTGRKQRGADDPAFELHPAILRGMAQMRDNTNGAAALTLFASPGMHVSYVWFKSGYPLPIHSHDTNCYYLVIAGSMKVGSEVLEKGDGVHIPGGAPYTVTPLDEGVEFLEIRESPDYDTHFRAKTDSYWDRVAETRQERKGIWAEEPQPYGLVPVMVPGE
jgi:mannose-6-phosphate isomerase-like protein (cupin superfamily)